jgi:hypothetical protein
MPVASLHIARYPLPTALRSAVHVWLRRADFENTPGLAIGALFNTADFWTLPSPKFNLRRYAILCCWEDEAAFDTFMDGSPLIEAFHRGASETWHAKLEPATVLEGQWRGWPDESAELTPLEDDDPVCVMTYGRVPIRQTWTFWRANGIVVRQARENPAMLGWLGLADRMGTASTFSVWRSVAEAKTFAYGPGDHAPVVRPSRTVPWLENRFFARFRPLSSAGTINGRDPVAEALSRNLAAAPSRG